MKPYYVKTKFNNILNITEIVMLHYYEFDNTYSFIGEEHDFWEMVYVDSGMVKITQDGEETILSQGEIAFHKPNEFHSLKSYKSSPNIVVISFVCKSDAMRYFEKFKTALHKDLKPFIASIISEAEDAYVIPKNDTSLKKLVKKDGRAIGSEQLIKIYLEQLLILLIRKLTEKNKFTLFPSKRSMETHLVSEIKKYIKEHLYEKVRVEDICKTFGYSKSYLSYLFKEQCSVSLARYYNECQIEEAKRLIREGNRNFSQISAMLNFDNPQYFARVFKRISGLTPSEFKNSLTTTKNQ